MADIKEVGGGGGGVAGTSEIDDNTDPSVLFESSDGSDQIRIKTTDDAEAVTFLDDHTTGTANESPKNESSGFVGVRTDTPVAPLHIMGTGGKTAKSWDATTNGSPTMIIENGSGNSKDRCTLEMNSTGSVGCKVRMHVAGTQKLDLEGTSTGGVLDGSNGTLILKSSGSPALTMDANQKLMTGAETTSMSDHGGSIHIYTGNSGQTDISGNADNLIIEGNANTGLSIASPHNSQAQIAFTANGVNNDRGAITYIHHGVTGGELMSFRVNDAVRATIGPSGVITPKSGAIQYHQGTGADTATTQAVYLADTNATLIIDFANGNFGDVTLAAGVTAVKFFNVPDDGTCATVTARITQDSSTRTIDYSDSAVTVYSDGGSTPITGEIKFSGGVHHTQSTGSGDADLVSFSAFRADGTATAITGATQADPCVITSNSHGLANGDKVTIASVSGMTQLNGNTYTVAGQTTNTFQLSGINSSGYGAYSSGGTFTLHIGNVYAAVIGQDFS